MLAELTIYKLVPILGPGPFRESRHLLPKLHSGPIISSKVRKFQRFQDETQKKSVWDLQQGAMGYEVFDDLTFYSAGLMFAYLSFFFI